MTGVLRVVVISQIWPQGSTQAKMASDTFDVTWRPDLAHVADSERLVVALEGAWAVVAGSERYSVDVLERLPGLRAIARPGVGVDAIDVDAASRLGIAVLVTPGTNDESVADHTIALMLAGLRRLVDLDRRTRAGSWRPTGFGRELFRSTVGVVGLGAIGRAVVRRLGGFECRILAVEPRPDPEFCQRYGVELRSLERLLPDVDILTVHVPLLAETRRMIGDAELRLLPRHALVVNAARGGIVDESALATALAEDRLGGAALDVFEHEPFRAEDPLAALENVVLSPHYAAFTREAAARMTDATVLNLIALASGRLPETCINRDALQLLQGSR
jgi:D-3-phosphoglycerate dehydrogenase / 2-oxoglutarate reductase